MSKRSHQDQDRLLWDTQAEIEHLQAKNRRLKEIARTLKKEHALIHKENIPQWNLQDQLADSRDTVDALTSEVKDLTEKLAFANGQVHQLQARISAQDQIISGLLLQRPPVSPVRPILVPYDSGDDSGDDSGETTDDYRTPPRPTVRSSRTTPPRTPRKKRRRH